MYSISLLINESKVYIYIYVCVCVYKKMIKLAKDNHFSFVTNVAKLEEVSDTTFEASSEIF